MLDGEDGIEPEVGVVLAVILVILVIVLFVESIGVFEEVDAGG